MCKPYSTPIKCRFIDAQEPLCIHERQESYSPNIIIPLLIEKNIFSKPCIIQATCNAKVVLSQLRPQNCTQISKLYMLYFLKKQEINCNLERKILHISLKFRAKFYDVGTGYWISYRNARIVDEDLGKMRYLDRETERETDRQRGTNGGWQIMNKVGDKTEKKTALANPRITNQQNLEWVIITVIPSFWRRAHHFFFILLLSQFSVNWSISFLFCLHH